jgi:hypothetical protein
MDFLFTRLALHLKEAGYASFSLGMAPLSGVAATPLASSWHQLSVLLWRYGGRIVTAQVTAVTRGIDRSRASTSQRVDGNARRHTRRR